MGERKKEEKKTIPKLIDNLTGDFLMSETA